MDARQHTDGFDQLFFFDTSTSERLCGAYYAFVAVVAPAR